MTGTRDAESLGGTGRFADGGVAAVVGSVLVSAWVLAAIAAPLLAPFDPLLPVQPFALPGTELGDGRVLWLGADRLGRDILSRILFGARTVLTYAPLAAAAAYLAGLAAGLAAGYWRGRIDAVLSFVANVILSFPVLVLYVIVIAAVGASATNIVLAVVFASAPGIMRLVRGLALEVAARDYVAAAEVRGEPAWSILLVEILPNVKGPLIVDACLRLGYVIITIGVLGFLGLGLPPPTPDWGGMVNENRQVALAFPHMTVFPCLAITSLVLGLNLLADGLGERSRRA